MWKCPKCGRSFKNKNQAHSCIKITEKEFFVQAHPHTTELYSHLKKILIQLQVQFQIEAVKNCIYFVNRFRFLAIKFHRTSIDIEFVLERKLNIFPVFKTVRHSKDLWWHIIRIEKEEELTEEIKDWLVEASKTKRKP